MNKTTPSIHENARHSVDFKQKYYLLSLFSHCWFAIPQLVLQADWQDVWHSPQPPFFALSQRFLVSNVWICFMIVILRNINIYLYFTLFFSVCQYLIGKTMPNLQKILPWIYTIFKILYRKPLSNLLKYWLWLNAFLKCWRVLFNQDVLWMPIPQVKTTAWEDIWCVFLTP